MGALTPWCVCNQGSEISVGIPESQQPQAEAVTAGPTSEEEVQALGTDQAKEDGLGS